MTIHRLAAERLRRHCDPESLTFETTGDLEHLEDLPGQERAVQALRFGVGVGHEGYNLYVLGRVGSGRHHLVDQLLRAEVESRPAADDWIYVYDFEHPSEPDPIHLPPGRGRVVRDDMERLVENLTLAIPAAFDTDAYRERRMAIDQALEKRRDEALAALQEIAHQRNLAVITTPHAIGLAPMQNGEIVAPDKLDELPEEERARLEKAISEVRGHIDEMLRSVPRWKRAQLDDIRSLDQEVTEGAVAALVDAVKSAHADLPRVVQFLEAVQADVVRHADQFRSADGEIAGLALLAGEASDGWKTRYAVNLLVDHAGEQGAPLIYEDNPTLLSLVGRVEHQSRLGMLVTNHTHVRPGALHRANGGFLVLDARKVLTQPYAWEHLKRALRSRRIDIESVGRAMGIVSTVTLEPEPIPLDLKVVLIGDRHLYQLLCNLDPEFLLLFKVPADFEDETPRTPAEELRFARLVASMVSHYELAPFDRTAVARILDEAARLSGDARKLSTHMQSLSELLCEADDHARRTGGEVVTASDVHGALEEARERSGRVRDLSLEAIEQGLLHIETDGSAVGQVNGLMVLPLGRGTFGRPGRITARVRMGTGGVLDILREVELGGPIHSKGVLILTGFIGARYATDRPLALSASVVMEQSYGGVEGDSASLAETCALLSALGQVALRQDIAVTGAIDQHGTVLAVGGVNEKIEGFFDVCHSRGLTGKQGVIIPASVAETLMLRDEVVAAAAEDRFHVWAVGSVDQAMALLTGLDAGERNKKGHFHPDTVNGKVEARLVELADTAQAFSNGKGGS